MHYKEYKTILSPHNGMNIFRGCSHGCIYCDSRSACYQMDHVFEDIEVKTDAPEILRRELSRKRKRCVIGTGSMSDPYIPLEERLLYTRKCLEAVEHNNFGLAILTKSDLILRDLDLLKKINGNAKCVVQMTLTTYDEKLCSIIEPGVCGTEKRVRALKVFKENGIPTVVWLCPILPFINDTAENLLGILDYCAEAGVRGILNYGIGMTLREGDREYFYAALDRDFPGLKEKYRQKYGLAYKIYSDNHPRMMEIFYAECKKHGIMCDNGEIFKYMYTLPEKDKQLTFF